MWGVLLLVGAVWGFTLTQQPDETTKFWGVILIALAVLQWRQIVFGLHGSMKLVTALLVFFVIMWSVNGKYTGAEFLTATSWLWIAPALLLLFFLARRTPTGYRVWWWVKTRVARWFH